MSAIVTSLNQSLIMSLENHRIAKEMWDYLQKRYVQESGALLYTLMQQIHTLEQGDMTIDEYYSAFDRLMGPLISMIPQCSYAKYTTQMLRSSLHIGLSWESGQNLNIFVHDCFMVLLSPWHMLCLIYLLKRLVFGLCQLLI
jgi:hypothetical protein